jgi:ABC-type transporter MlaC component
VTQVAAVAPVSLPARVEPPAATPVSLTPRAEPAASPPVPAPAPPPAKQAAARPVKPVPAPIATVTQPADPIAAAGFVEHFLAEAFRIARSDGTTSLQRRAQLADLFGSKMDIRRMAGYTTADELTEMSPDIQQRFRTILISYLVETYYPRLELASDPEVRVETTPVAALPGGMAEVSTSFSKEGWGTQSVKWQLAAEKDGFKIVDIYSAGASLVQMERDTFVSVMRDGGVPELMAKLDARTKQLATAAPQ